MSTSFFCGSRQLVCMALFFVVEAGVAKAHNACSHALSYVQRPADACGAKDATSTAMTTRAATTITTAPAQQTGTSLGIGKA